MDKLKHRSMKEILIRDETADGRLLNEVMVYTSRSQVTVRELIAMRLREERGANQTSLRAFREDGFLIRINNRQVCDLTEKIALDYQTRISFIALSPDVQC